MARVRVEKNISYDEGKKLYYVCFNYDKDENGKYIKRYKTFTNLAEARKERDLRETERNYRKKHQKEDKQPSKMSIEEAIIQFIEVEKSEMEASTKRDYETNLKKTFLNWCNANKLTYVRQLKRSHFKAYFNYLRDEVGYHPNTIAKHYSSCKSLCKMLVRESAIEKNWVMEIDAPVRVDPRPEDNGAFTELEAARILKHFMGDKLEIYILLMLFEGLRPEEVSGLKWDDIDWDENCMRLDTARVTVKKKHLQKGLKTPTSYRTLYLAPRVRDKLLEMKKEQEENRELFGDGYTESPYVCVKADGRPHLPKFADGRWHRERGKAGLDGKKLYDFRKTFASLAILEIPEAEVQRAMGHKGRNVTERHYIHIYGAHNKRVVMAVSDIIEDALKGKDFEAHRIEKMYREFKKYEKKRAV